VGPEADVVVALSEILQEAGRLRVHESPPGEAEELDRRWEEIARDVGALAREVESGALTEPQLYRGSGGTAGSSDGGRVIEPAGPRALRSVASGVARRSARAGKVVSRRSLGTAKRVAGPRLRSIERRSIDQAGRVAELLATQAHVAADHARRVATSGGRSGRLDRVSPRGRVLPSAPGAPGPSGSWELARSPRPGAGRNGGADSRGADADRASDLERWVIERLERCPGGLVLHVECGDGEFVQRLIEAGHEAAGADPAAAAGSDTVARAGALERLGSQDRRSLGGLVVSGATEQVSPGSARALIHLASTRLRRDGIVVLVSVHPSAADAVDLISADLVSRRPLHPVTWCHLLARFGFCEITVIDPGAPGGPAGSLGSAEGGQDAGGTRGAYAVAARRS
jgi:hypothetical protein